MTFPVLGLRKQLHLLLKKQTAGDTDNRCAEPHLAGTLPHEAHHAFRTAHKQQFRPLSRRYTIADVQRCVFPRFSSAVPPSRWVVVLARRVQSSACKSICTTPPSRKSKLAGDTDVNVGVQVAVGTVGRLKQHRPGSDLSLDCGLARARGQREPLSHNEMVVCQLAHGSEDVTLLRWSLRAGALPKCAAVAALTGMGSTITLGFTSALFPPQPRDPLELIQLVRGHTHEGIVQILPFTPKPTSPASAAPWIGACEGDSGSCVSDSKCWHVLGHRR